MPNWCECDMWVRGPRKELEEFKSKANASPREIYNINIDPKTDDERASKVLDLLEGMDNDKVELCSDAFVKIPMDLLTGDKTKTDEELKQLYGVTNQYDWCIKNWGSKWGICHPSLDRDSRNMLKYVFESPWGPPMALVHAMSKQHPRVEILLKYYERGMGFKGSVKLKAGEYLDDAYCDNYTGSRGG